MGLLEPNEYIKLVPGHESDAVFTTCRQMVEGSLHNGFRLRKYAGWIAMPVEGAFHFSSTNRRRLMSAFKQHQTQTVYAVKLESINVPFPFMFPPTLQGLNAFHRCCGPFNFALLPQTPVWVRLCLDSGWHDFFVIVGPEDFVQAAIEVPQYMLYVYKTLRYDYAQAPIDTFVEF